ncbi:hypothetical protein BH20ACT24_BH20ACT24_01640 [soil metagenome]
MTVRNRALTGGLSSRSVGARSSAILVSVLVCGVGLVGLEPAALASSGPPGSEVPSVVAVDVAVEAGIFEQTETYGAVVHDFNVDGRPDILLGRHGEYPSRLYLHDVGNDGFTEVAPGTFVQSDRHDCAAADVNGDGLPDALCTRGSNDGNGVKTNEMWIQGPVNTFVSRPGEWGVVDPFARGKRAAFLDANGDGRPDLFIGNDPTRVDGLPSRNRFMLNDGTTFRFAPEMGVDLDIGARCVDTADFNADGWKDLIVCAEETGTRLYRNAIGTGFVDVSAEMGVPESDDVRQAIMVDVNGDGQQDLVQVLTGKVEVLLQKRGEFTSVFTKELEDGHALAAGDVNADGSPDLYVVQTGSPNRPDVMLMNDGTGKGYGEIAVPQATDGQGDAVSALDYDGNGLTDFLVLNGQKSPGPVQLIAFFPELGSRGIREQVQTSARGVEAPTLGPAAPAVPLAFGNLQTLTERWKDGAWTIVPSPNPSRDNNTLRSASALGTGEVWGVGYFVEGAGGFTLAERWDGQEWIVVPTADPGASANYLFGVEALAPTNVWAVGSGRVGGTHETLAERWDGSSWTIVQSPNAGSESNVLHGISAVNGTDMWAVGRFADEGGSHRTLAEHWDGTSWEISRTPNSGEGHNVLLGVWAESRRTAWAVGYRHNGTVYRTLVQRWNGRSWRLIPSPNVGTGDNLLLSVSGSSADDVWAVGYRVEGGELQTLVEHWDGRAWKVVTSPNPGQGAAALRSVVAADASDAWGVGTYFDPGSGYLHTLTIRWDGSAWTVVDSEDVPGEDNELIDVVLSPEQDEVWGVGSSYNVIKEGLA